MSLAVGISGMGVYLPDARESTTELLARNGACAAQVTFLERVHKLRQVALADPGERLETFLRKALALVDLAGIELVLYAHSMMPQVPARYHLFAKLGLPKVPAFGISQLNCASGIMALEIALRAGKKTLLITGDLTSFLPSTRYIRNTTIVGDSASAVVLSPGHPRLRLLATSLLSDTRFCDGFYESEEKQKQFSQSYIENLTRAMRSVLSKADVSLADVKLLIPHNVNCTTWKRFCRETGFPLEQVVLDHVSELGHSYSNDFQLNLKLALEQGRLHKGDYFLATSVGIGGYFSAALFQY